jgi:aryl-alcohol dehydrogenase-like predicted oxidoreductase
MYASAPLMAVNATYAEQVLGKALQDIPRDQIVIATKVKQQPQPEHLQQQQ